MSEVPLYRFTEENRDAPHEIGDLARAGPKVDTWSKVDDFV